MQEKSFSQTVIARRTIRLFSQQPIPDDQIRQLLELARISPAASNLQRLRYIVCRTKQVVDQIFPHTGWAGLVKPRRTPVLGETSPTAFIAVLAPENANAIVHADAGAAIMAILLGAQAAGLGACWLGSFNQQEVRQIINIPEGMTILYLVALGYPAEQPIRIDVSSKDKVAYFINDDGVLTVPKLTVDAITQWR